MKMLFFFSSILLYQHYTSKGKFYLLCTSYWDRKQGCIGPKICFITRGFDDSMTSIHGQIGNLF